MSDLLTPPRIPAAVLCFFANQPDFSVLVGDVSEEFQQRAQKSGARAAERWFWREAIRNAWALTLRELLGTPVRIVAIALGCATAVNLMPVLSVFFVVNLNSRLPLSPYVGWAVLAAFPLLTSLLVGWAGSRLAAGREWGLALLFTLVSASWATAGVLTLSDLYASSGKEDFSAVHVATMLIGPRLPGMGLFWLGSLWIRAKESKRLAGADLNGRVF